MKRTFMRQKFYDIQTPSHTSTQSYTCAFYADSKCDTSLTIGKKTDGVNTFSSTNVEKSDRNANSMRSHENDFSIFNYHDNAYTDERQDIVFFRVQDGKKFKNFSAASTSSSDVGYHSFSDFRFMQITYEPPGATNYLNLWLSLELKGW